MLGTHTILLWRPSDSAGVGRRTVRSLDRLGELGSGAEVHGEHIVGIILDGFRLLQERGDVAVICFISI